jgi:hypothetical protein
VYSVDAARWGRTLRRPLQHVDVYLTAFRAPGQKATRVFRAADLPSQLPLNLTLFSMLSGDDVLRSAALPNPFTESMPSMARLVIVLYSEQYMQIYCKYSMYADNQSDQERRKAGESMEHRELDLRHSLSLRRLEESLSRTLDSRPVVVDDQLDHVCRSQSGIAASTCAVTRAPKCAGEKSSRKGAQIGLAAANGAHT